MTRNRWTLLLALLVITAGALSFRAGRLTDRPFHGDEAIHAVKLGDLLESGKYAYDPFEYHGPTLNYFTLPVMWMTGKTYLDASEAYYRIVPVIFGSALILLLWLVRRELGTWGVAWGAVFTAISPAMVFYSRYYIMEMLLVFFTFLALAACWRYARSGKAGWALLAGTAFGLMHATKETWVIALPPIAGAAILTVLWVRWIDSQRVSVRSVLRWKALIAAAIAGILLASLFLSGFFVEAAKAPTVKGKLLAAAGGPWNSVIAYKTYLDRSGNTDHNHPWAYYLKLLAWTRYGRGPWWSEGFVLALAAVGGLAALLTRRKIAAPCGSSPRPILAIPREEGDQAIAGALIGVFSQEPISAASQRRGHGESPVTSPEPPAINWRWRFLVFLLFYTLLLTVAYSDIPYKTPWCLLSFYHGMILLAGVGAAALVKCMPHWTLKTIMAMALLAGAAQLGWQSYRTNFVFYCDPRNPYVYSHPRRSMYDLIQRMEDLAKVSPDGHRMLVKVFTKDIWPIPWYLRRFERIGCWPKVQDNADAPVIICSPDQEEELAKKLKAKYQPDYYGLRPTVVLSLYVRMDLWEAFLKTRR